MINPEVLMDSFYNQRAANWARETVMKMDDGEAQEFVTHVTRSVLLEDMANNKRTIDGHIMEIQKSLLRDAERVVSKGVFTPVDIVAEISKAFGSDPFARDKSGRFSTVESRVRVNRAQQPLKRGDEQAQGIHSAKKLAAATGTRSGKLTPVERSAYQQQYLQLADAMDRSIEGGGNGVTAILQDKTTGRRSTAHFTSLSKPSDLKGWNPGRQDLVAVRTSENGSPAGQASFNLVSSLAGERSANGAQGATQGIESGGSAFAQRWTDASGDTAGTNDRTYRRIEAG